MEPEVIRKRPRLAAAILIAGVGVYWLICQPAMWRRGYPEIAPFWLCMPWLWIAVVPISAVWDDDRKRRLWAVIIYAIVTGFIEAGPNGGQARPRHVRLEQMAILTIVFGPYHLVVAVVIEWLSQRSLKLLRRFSRHPICEKCAYNITHLTVARCPECGTPFDEQWLDPSHSPPSASRLPRRMLCFSVAVIGAAAAAPYAYDRAMLSAAARTGRAEAKADWANNRAIWYVKRLEARDVGPWEWDTYDRTTGLKLRHMPLGVEWNVRYEAYRSVIERKIAQLGPGPMARNLLTDDDLRAVLNGGELTPVGDSPVQFGKVTVKPNGGYTVPHGSGGFTWGGTPPERARYTILSKEADLLVLVTDRTIDTFLRNGEHLQHIEDYPDSLGIPPPTQR